MHKHHSFRFTDNLHPGFFLSQSAIHFFFLSTSNFRAKFVDNFRKLVTKKGRKIQSLA